MTEWLVRCPTCRRNATELVTPVPLPEDSDELALASAALPQGASRTSPISSSDQFEEVFTLGAQRPGAENEVREALAILLQGAIPEPISQLIAEHDDFLDHFDPDSTPVRIVLALRDDYVYALNRWKRHLPALGQNNFELRALRGPAAFDAVFKPGELRCKYRRAKSTKRTELDTGLPPIVNEETARAHRPFRRKEGRRHAHRRNRSRSTDSFASLQRVE